MSKIDLRVVKTKENIQRIFLELLSKKSYDDISVKEVCTLANCSRNTFYMHYADKDALVDTIFDECIAKILSDFSPNTSSLQEVNTRSTELFMDGFFHSIKDNAELLQIIIGSDLVTSFSNRLSAALFDKYIENGKIYSKMKAYSDEYQLMSKYAASGFVSFAIHWLNSSSLDFETTKAILHNVTESTISYSIAFFKEQ